MTFKTITIKKRGGGTRKQKVKVLASGKFRFVKNSTKTTKRIKVSKFEARGLRKSKRRGDLKKNISIRGRTILIKKIKPRKTMAKRRRSTSRKSSTKGIMSTVKRFAKPIAIGLGTGAVLSIGASAIGQPGLGNNKLIGAAAAFLLGGPVAGGAALLLGGGLGNLFGGNNGGGNMV